MKKQPKVVVLGGGTGLSVLLRGLKHYPVEITAIVTVADDGGSSGRLRRDYDMPPPGDVRNVIAALSEVEPLVEKMFQHRFKVGDGITGHSLGNLLLAAMHDITGDFLTGIRELSRVLNVRGQVLPAAKNSIILSAELEDGTIVQGESKIPLSNKKIRRVFLNDENIEPLRESVKAIQDADLIVIGPGSLYTSILPNLLVGGISKAIREATAPRVYVCNVMTQPGETTDYTAGDHVQALIDHVGHNFIDVVIVNNETIPPEFLDLYLEEGASQVLFDEERLRSFGIGLVCDNIIQYGTLVRHDAKRVSDLLLGLIEK
ncbi:gluconeogenesis factor YvcK family protein [Fictibacillus phosphorivorans]|uniref:gluconeogenesis factor YvcK family protein n=1 Tax=Fictibacillus phosphorivorans TaxID=1221500 RepID=UPI00203DE5A5|nr:YvcK family protein [Fictibacillus phosphorivorans]MCM3718260.1 YvcK family protein [Fictibacillus phosphorivorans]MCM3775874.1 YvcK family protein [Fictibacillus phosphorivorans]